LEIADVQSPPLPNPQTPIPNPQSPIINEIIISKIINNKKFIFKYFNLIKIK